MLSILTKLGALYYNTSLIRNRIVGKGNRPSLKRISQTVFADTWWPQQPTELSKNMFLGSINRRLGLVHLVRDIFPTWDFFPPFMENFNNSWLFPQPLQNFKNLWHFYTFRWNFPCFVTNFPTCYIISVENFNKMWKFVTKRGKFQRNV